MCACAVCCLFMCAMFWCWIYIISTNLELINLLRIFSQHFIDAEVVSCIFSVIKWFKLLESSEERGGDGGPSTLDFRWDLCVFCQTDTSERVQCPLDSKRSDVVAGYKLCSLRFRYQTWMMVADVRQGNTVTQQSRLV